MKRLMMTTLAAAALSLTGCKTTPDAGCKCNPCRCAAPCACGTTAMGMMNNACPMSDKTLTDGCPTSSYAGKTVGFCGNGCKGTFDGSDDAGKKKMIAACQTN